VGAVLSIFTAGDVNVAALPALSVTVTVPVTAEPSVDRTSGLLPGFVDATPDVASAAVNVMDTFVLFHPLGAGPNVSVGGVLSILIPLAVAGALTLPALSVHDPDADWLAPSEDKVTGLAQLSIPDKLSVPLKLTVTSVLFQPLAFAAGARVAAPVGAVLSILILEMVKDAVFPARSWHV
jgi:hypothetical protein